MADANGLRSFISFRFERTVTWITRHQWRILAVSMVMGAFTFLAECAVHLLVFGRKQVGAAMSDALALGALFTVFTFLVLLAARDRHRKVQDDLRRIAELNHRIRNALQIIIYGEASRLDCEGRTAVMHGVEKIDATLKEMFPLVGERRDDRRPWETYNNAQLQHRQSEMSVKDRRKPAS
jgi:hypothetical protein